MGLVNLMAWVDAGSHLQPNYQGPEVKNLREWAEIVRRLQLPYYEEARLHMHLIGRRLFHFKPKVNHAHLSDL